MHVRATTRAAADDRRRHDRRRRLRGRGRRRTTSRTARCGRCVDAGEARTKLQPRSRVAHAAGQRWILVGPGRARRLDAERARVAAAAVRGPRAGARHRALCWELPAPRRRRVAGALVEGTAARRLPLRRASRPSRRRRRTQPARAPDRQRPPRRRPRRSTRAAVRARPQNARARPAEHARQRPHARPRSPTARAELAARSTALTSRSSAARRSRRAGWARSRAVAQGIGRGAALIVLRYDAGRRDRPACSALVGKAVTFDAGGISIKPAGEDARDEVRHVRRRRRARGDRARSRGSGCRVRVIAVIGATENMPSGRAVKPGDIVARDGRHDDRGQQHRRRGPPRPRRLPAPRARAGRRAARRPRDAHRRRRDRARLGLRRADEQRRRLVRRGARRRRARPASRSGACRCTRRYAKAIKGRYADITNSPGATARRRRSSAAEFLHRFAGDVPWAHLDIAGVGERHRPAATRARAARAGACGCSSSSRGRWRRDAS